MLFQVRAHEDAAKDAMLRADIEKQKAQAVFDAIRNLRYKLEGMQPLPSEKQAEGN
jgi:hypothetical protein